MEYEYVEGGDLTGLIQEMHARGRVKPEVANRLLLRLAEIVAFAHKAEPPIVHGDLKPANVLVRRTAEGKTALRVIDFGIGGLAAARAAQEVRKPTRSRPQLLTEAVRGAYTPLYASPEQMARRPGELADPRDDVHALGVIWFQLITGDLAMTSFPTDWREQLGERGVGENLIKLVGACVAPKADKRPANAVVLIEQIKGANVPMAELADGDAAGAAKTEKSRAAAAKTAKPEKGRDAPATVKPPPQATTAGPAVKSSKKLLLTAVAGGVVLVGVIVLCAGVLFFSNRQPRNQGLEEPSKPIGGFPDDKGFAGDGKGFKPKENIDQVTKENFDRLKVGITDNRVQVWQSGENRILAAFPDAPSASSKVEVLLKGNPRELTQKPADKWMVSKDNFLKLKVGMTLKELEDVLGIGEKATAFPFKSFDGKDKDEKARKEAWNKGWEKAVKEYRVYRWQENPSNYKPGVMAAFPGPPTAATKVEALIYRDGVWDEDKGELSGTK